jgi:hypothetical protein
MTGGLANTRRFTVGHLLYFGNPMQFKRGTTCACTINESNGSNDIREIIQLFSVLLLPRTEEEGGN